MSGFHRSPFVAAIVISVLVVTSGVCNLSATGHPPSTTVIVRVFDSFSVGDGLATALDEAASIFRTADVDIVWLECTVSKVTTLPPACGEVPASNELLLRLVASPGGAVTLSQVSMGSSLIDLELAAGVLATVFPDRVHLVAQAAGVDTRIVLGRVIAHEIGHLLLGQGTHADHGLMRGYWSRQSLQRTTAGDWVFSDGERARIQNGVVARLMAPGQPVAVTAVSCPGTPGLSSPPCGGSFGATSTGSSALR